MLTDREWCQYSIGSEVEGEEEVEVEGEVEVEVEGSPQL